MSAAVCTHTKTGGYTSSNWSWSGLIKKKMETLMNSTSSKRLHQGFHICFSFSFIWEDLNLEIKRCNRWGILIPRMSFNHSNSLRRMLLLNHKAPRKVFVCCSCIKLIWIILHSPHSFLNQFKQTYWYIKTQIEMSSENIYFLAQWRIWCLHGLSSLVIYIKYNKYPFSEQGF